METMEKLFDANGREVSPQEAATYYNLFTLDESYLFDTDSYKVSHWLQYPPGTRSMFSYIESRGGEYDKTVFFGLQYIAKRYLTHRVTVAEVEEARDFWNAHGEPFNYEGWMYIATKLQGKIPIRIRAVPEGSLVPTHNVLATIESTDPKVFWVVSWMETMLLRMWYPVNVATRSHKIRQIIMQALEVSSDDPKEEIKFKLHDFGSRGVSSQESAKIGGAAHLVNFFGSDTGVGIRMANKYYYNQMAGFSIPAMEHSSVTSWGRENEVEAYRNMLRRTGKPGGLIACVSDSYDFANACSHLWGEELRQEVIDSGCMVVIRPDSGNPPEIVLRGAQLLAEKFGYTINTKGYKVLNYVRLLQGDGVNEHSIQKILDVLLDNGFSATNIAFGMGGALLQQHNRDTLKFAMKCSQIYRLVSLIKTDDEVLRHNIQDFVLDGERVVSIPVYKDPATDHGKISKPGRLDLIKVKTHDDESYQTVVLDDGELSHPMTVMEIVFENGEVLVDHTLDEIRTLLLQETV